MNTFVVYNEDGTIQSCADWKFPNSVEVTFDVVRGWDGKLYEAGGEPIKPAPTLEDQLAAIEAEYAPKIAALQTALVAATLAGGSIMDGNIASLRTEWAALLNEKSAAMEALLV